MSVFEFKNTGINRNYRKSYHEKTENPTAWKKTAQEMKMKLWKGWDSQKAKEQLLKCAADISSICLIHLSAQFSCKSDHRSANELSRDSVATS